jgi:rhamnosyltransferase subunit B
VIVPISHDQPDNALRVQRLSAGDIVPNSRLRPDILAETLRKVVSSESMHQACREIARRISRVDPFAAACDVIEQYAARHGASPAASAGLDRQSGRPNPRTSSLLSG